MQNAAKPLQIESPIMRQVEYPAFDSLYAVYPAANRPAPIEKTRITVATAISPVGSLYSKGLLPQYANILLPRMPCPVLFVPSALINLPSSGL